MEIYLQIIAGFILLFMLSVAIVMVGDIATKTLGNVIFSVIKAIKKS